MDFETEDQWGVFKKKYKKIVSPLLHAYKNRSGWRKGVQFTER